ncbi:MAG: hypothetical protein AB1611_20620 [bacterium]
MSRLLRSLQISDPQTLIEIITEAVDEIQSGATIVDTSLGNEEYGCIDLIAADRNKRGILFFITTSSLETDFLRPFKCLCWYRENRPILQKLYSGVIDIALPPSIYFISPAYSDIIRKVLLNLKEYHITLLKYTCFQDGESIKVFLEKIAALPDDTSLPEIPSLRNQLEKWLRTSQSDNSPRKCPSDDSLQTSQPDRSPLYPPDKTPAGKSGKPAFDTARFRQEIGFDISNISDEELHDLLLE